MVFPTHSKLVTTEFSSLDNSFATWVRSTPSEESWCVFKIARSFKGCYVWVERKYVFNIRSVENDLSAC